jgi:ubiquinone/menaquinone biosynthesis C-methylase UbiE
MNVFDEMGVYWAEIADRNQTEDQLEFLKSHLKPKGSFLDLACGTGRHLIPLCQQGFDIVGLDVSFKLLQIAKHRSKEIQLVRSDMLFLPFNTETFNVAVSMDTSFGYLPSLQDDQTALAEVIRILKPKGVFIIDVFNRQQLTYKYKNQKQPIKNKEYPSFFLQQQRSVAANGDWLCDMWNIHVKATGEKLVFEHSVRLYEDTSLKNMLNKAGFIVKHIYGGYGNENFCSEESPHLILVAEKT